MNEAELMIYVLSQKKDNITVGATEEELLKKLAFTDRNRKQKLLVLIDELSKNIYHLGLRIKYNPANQHWFIGFKDNSISSMLDANNNNLPTKLAATLFTILILSINSKSKIQISEIKKIRKKKDIRTDLEELEEKGYIKINSNAVNLTPKIFYFVDIDELASEIQNISRDLSNDIIDEEQLNKRQLSKEKIDLQIDEKENK